MSSGTVPAIVTFLGCAVNNNGNATDCVSFYQAYGGTQYTFSTLLIISFLYLFFSAVAVALWSFMRKRALKDHAKKVSLFYKYRMTNEKFCEMITKLTEIFKIASILLLMINWSQFVEFFCQRPEILVLAGLPNFDSVGNQIDLNCHAQAFQEYVIYPALQNFVTALPVFPIPLHLDSSNVTVLSPTTPAECLTTGFTRHDCFTALKALVGHMCNSGQTHRPERLIFWYSTQLFFETIGFLFIILVLPHHLSLSPVPSSKHTKECTAEKIGVLSRVLNCLLIFCIFAVFFISGIFWIVNMVLMAFESDHHIQCQSTGVLNNLSVNLVFIVINMFQASLILGRVVGNLSYFNHMDRNCTDHCDWEKIEEKEKDDVMTMQKQITDIHEKLVRSPPTWLPIKDHSI